MFVITVNFINVSAAVVDLVGNKQRNLVNASIIAKMCTNSCLSLPLAPSDLNGTCLTKLIPC